VKFYLYTGAPSKLNNLGAKAWPRSEAVSEANGRKIPRFIQTAYEVVPSTIVMTARREVSVVIHLCVLKRIDP